MIRLWISPRSTLPIREQLSAQLLLGILSRRLAPGEKLPSVRELARRLKIHGNTVLAVYQDLAQRGWVQSRPGSGVFVKELAWPHAAGGLDDLVRAFLREARALGHSVEEVRAALDRCRLPQRWERLLVVDSDAELARILAAEIADSAGRPVAFASCAQAAQQVTARDFVMATSGQAEHVAKALGSLPFHVIHLKSMQEVLAGQQRPPFPVLVGVVSHSPSLLAWAGTLLASLGFDADSVLLRDASQAGWQEGLAACAIVAADIVAAELLAPRRPILIRLVSADSLAEVGGLVEGL